MRDELEQFSPSYSGTLPPREIVISTGTKTTPRAGGGGGGTQQQQQEDIVEMPILGEGQRTPSHAHLKQCKSHDSMEGIEVEIESVATSPNDPKIKRFTFDLPTPSSANNTNHEVEERDVVEETMEFADSQMATANNSDVNNNRILNNLTAEARDAVLDAWGGLSPMSEDDRSGERTDEAFTPKSKVGAGENDAPLEVIEESLVETVTKPSDEKESVLIVEGKDKEPVAKEGQNAESRVIVAEDEDGYCDKVEEKQEISGVAEPGDAALDNPDVTEETETASEPSPVAVSPDTVKVPEPADLNAAVPESKPSQKPHYSVTVCPSESVNTHKPEPSVLSVPEPSESVEVEVQQMASVVDVVKTATVDERDAVLDAWGLSQEQLDKKLQDTTAKDKKMCLQELVLCYDPSTELIPPAFGSPKAIAEAVADDQRATKMTEPPSTKVEGTLITKVEEKISEDPKVEKIQSAKKIEPNEVSTAKAKEPAAVQSRMSETVSAVSHGSVKAKVAMWERKLREVPFDEPPVESPKEQQGNAEQSGSITSQATQEQSNLANACAATFVEGTHCAPADTTVSFDDTNIGPIASLLDKEDDDSQVAVREVVAAPSDEDKDHLSSNRKDDAARDISTNGGQKVKDGGTEVDESLEIELVVEQDGTTGDVCGASTISADVITYLFSPRNKQLFEATMCCTPSKANASCNNAEGAPKQDADFSKNDICSTDK